MKKFLYTLIGLLFLAAPALADTFTVTPTDSPTATVTRTATPTATPTSTRTFTASPTISRTFTATRTITLTRTPQPTRTFTKSPTSTKTPSPSITPTVTVTPTVTITTSPTITPTFVAGSHIVGDCFTFTATNPVTEYYNFTLTGAPTGAIGISVQQISTGRWIGGVSSPWIAADRLTSYTLVAPWAMAYSITGPKTLNLKIGQAWLVAGSSYQLCAQYSVVVP